MVAGRHKGGAIFLTSFRNSFVGFQGPFVDTQYKGYMEGTRREERKRRYLKE